MPCGRRLFFRNPDEFYHKMINAQLHNGIHSIKHEGKNSTAKAQREQAHLDSSWVTMKKVMESRKVSQMESQLARTDSTHKGTHTIFCDDEEAAKSFDAATHFDTAPQFVDRTFNRPRLETLKEQAVKVPKHMKDADPATVAKWLAKLEKQRKRQYQELEEHKEKESLTKQALEELTMKKALMGKGNKRKITIEDPNNNSLDAEPTVVWKWKRARNT